MHQVLIVNVMDMISAVGRSFFGASSEGKPPAEKR